MKGFTDLFRQTPFAAAMDASPVTLIDVGARGGFEPSLLPIAFATDAVGFEPEAAARRELEAAPTSPWRSQRHLPFAIGPNSGDATLYVTEAPESSSLLRPLAATGEEFGKTAYSRVVREETVETVTLDEALAAHRIVRADYLKLDIEGLEGAALRAAPDTLRRALAVKIEVGFMPFRDGQTLAHTIAGHLSENGFRLMDMIGPARWRRHGHVIHPTISAEAVPYSRGQLAHADYLFFREPAALADNGAAAVRGAWIALAHGYFDHAERLLALPGAAEALMGTPLSDIASALASASRTYGRRVWHESLYRQLRGLIPILRSGVRLLRG